MIQFLPLKRLALLAIGLLAFQSVFSQGKYMPGFVIMNNADTLHGFVDYREWDENPDMIWFKTYIKSESVAYKPTDIAGFKVADNLYVSGIVDVEYSRTETQYLDQFPDARMRVDTTFLLTLFESDKSLYFYKSIDGRSSLYIKNDTAFELLLYKRYIKNDLGRKTVMENKTFMGQLILYLSDCDNINSRIKLASYNKESLTVLFKNYFKCVPTKIHFQKKSRILDLESGVIAGASQTSFKFINSGEKEIYSTIYPVSNNFSGGFYLNFIMPRDKWSIYNEIMYSTYKVSGHHEETYKSNTSTIYTSLGMTYIKLNNMIRYKQPVGKMHLFINGGISNGYAVNEINTTSKVYQFLGNREIPALYSTRSYELGWIAGAGASYKRFSLEARYESGSGISNNTEVKRIFCLFGYRF